MKLKRITALIICALSIFLFSCGNSGKVDFENDVKVVFELQGGKYRNSTTRVTQYYKFEKGTQNLIHDLVAFSKEELQNPGYSFEGWFTDEEYQNQWDFENDKVGDDGITLYAKWVKKVQYTFELYRKDEENKDVHIKSYKTKEGGKFKGKLKDAKLSGKTPYRFVDENGNLWNDNFIHPGKNVSAVKIYVEYIDGDWDLVYNAADLRGARKDIYLMNDIDFAKERNKNLALGDLIDRNFNGNGHAIKNFSIAYDASKDSLVDDINPKGTGKSNTLLIGLFGNVKNSTIKDVNFENVTVKVETGIPQIKNVYVSPLAINMTNSKFENVKFSGTYEIVNKIEDWESLVIVKGESYLKDNVVVADEIKGWITFNDVKATSKKEN